MNSITYVTCNFTLFQRFRTGQDGSSCSACDFIRYAYVSNFEGHRGFCDLPQCLQASVCLIGSPEVRP
jgi:hypothetical protein